jgi:outer membrane protein TolC
MRIEGHKRFAATGSRQGGIMSERRFKNGFGVFSVIGSMLLMVAPAIGAEDTEETPWMPGAVTQESISALEAVQLTLEHAPFIRLKEQDTLYREGIVLQAAGQFDMTLVGNLSYEYTQTELTAQEAKGEQDRRDATEENLGFAQDAVEQNQTSLDESTAAREVWDSGGDVTSVRFSDPLAQAQYEILIQSYQSAPPDQQPLFEEAMINFFDAIMVDSQEGLDEAQARSAELEDQLDRMGDVPEVTQSFDASLNLMLNKQFRNGIRLSPYLDLSGTGVRYKDKGYLSDDGGMEVPDAYTTKLGFDVVIPLGRNRGRDATGAIERASQIDYDASLDALAFSASTSALETLVAYWNLVAAQRSLEIRETSLDINRRILEMTQTLIDADELPRAEISRTQATVAQEEAAVEAARRGVIEARVRLAGAMGLEVGGGAIAPLASDQFPAPPSDIDAVALDSGSMVPEALERRLDLSSARKLESSGKVLAEAARLNLRRVTDLDIGLSYNNLGEDNNVWDGIGDSVSGKWAGPSGKIGVTIDWPFANNTQEGRLQQQEAAWRTSQISSTDLERTVGLGITSDAASIKYAARQSVGYGQAVASYKEAVNVEMERLQYGTVTVLDTLITQQRSLSSELALIGAQAQYARLLAQLSFDTGRLIVQEDGQGSINASAFTVLPGQ